LCFNVQLSGCSRCTVFPRFVLWGGAMFDCRLDCHIEVHAKPCCLFIMSQYQCTKHMQRVPHLLSTDLGFVMSPFPGPARGRRAVHTGVQRGCAVGGRRPDRGAVFDVVMGVQHFYVSRRERRPAPTNYGNGLRGTTPSVRQTPPNGLADQVHTNTCCDRFLGECCIILQVERNEFRGGTKP
jgi:hypothetical protein